MLGIALNWMRGNWQTVIVGVLIVALAIWIGSLKLALGAARGDVARLNGEVAGWKSRYASLEQKALEQQKAVEEMHAASEKKRKAGIHALAEAKKRATDAQAQAAWLAEQLAKAGNGKGCAQAFSEWRQR